MIEFEREACLKHLRDLGLKHLLVIQDSTSFNFSHHPKTRGLGVLEDNRSQGFFAHSSLAVSLEGLPVGLLEQKVWIRSANPQPKDNAHQKLAIHQKESYKWINGLASSLQEASNIDYITICDREGDIYEVFQYAENHGAKFIVRAAKNRRLEDGGLLFRELQQLSTQLEFEIEIASRRGAETRLTTVSLRYGSFKLLPPKNRSAQNRSFPLQPLSLQVIEVHEVSCPDGFEPVHWILVTNLPVATTQAAQQVLLYYSYRWLVERFHYVLKSGCEFEDSQLQSYDALKRFLGLCSSVAWQLLRLTYQARINPDVACTVVLSDSEWQALTAYMNQSSETPQIAPTLHQAVRWIGQLGGFLGRKHDGEPGVKVLWRGWKVLQSIHAAWLVFHPPPNPHPA